MTAEQAAPLLSLTGITHRFGPTKALDDAALHVRAGTVHAVLGENGAGKTTLLRVAFGMLQPDAGLITWQQRSARIGSPAAALALGIGMVHQHFTLVPAMTVAENVALGGHGAFHPATAAARVREVGARAGLELDAEARVDSLPVGAQQRCEIIKALARDVKLLVLDEPTAVLAPSEAAELLAWMRRYADSGHAVVLITHKLRDALAIADDVTVLRRGRVVFTARAADTSEQGLAAAMLGDDPQTIASGLGGDAVSTAASTIASTTASSIAGATTATIEATATRAERVSVIRARDIHARDARGVVRVRGVSLDIGAGEIVGIAAVEGAGQHELLRVLAGRLRPSRGTLEAPAETGFVPEDRHHDALMLDAPLFENLALRGAGARRGRIGWDALRNAAARIIAARDVRAAGNDVAARTLSGGNQQKFVLGRELADAPAAIVLENPSRGLDFRATAAVHTALRNARDAGAAVLLYSSDLDEVLALSDRVLAMHAGTLTEMPNDRELVGRAILGTVTAPSIETTA